MWILWTLLGAGLVAVMTYRLIIVPGRTPALPSLPTISSGVLKTVAWIVVAALAMGLMWYFQVWNLTTFSWADTVPGQAIDKWLGVGWAPWVMWILVVLFVAGLLSLFLSKGKVWGGVIKWIGSIALVALLVVGFSAVMDWHRAKPQAYVPVELHTLKAGESRTVPMGLSSIAVIKIAGTNVKDGYGMYACPEAKALQGMMKVKYRVPAGNHTNRLQVEMTPASKQELLARNIVAVDTTFTLTKGPTFGKTPCAFTEE